MSENHEIVMQAKHIVKQFPASRGRTLTACNDINLTMYKGKTLGIVGESGCGKSKTSQDFQRKKPGKTARTFRWFSRIRWHLLTRR